MNSMNALVNTPVSTAAAFTGDPVPGMLSNVATLKRDSIPTNANQANVQPVYEIYANVRPAISAVSPKPSTASSRKYRNSSRRAIR